MAKYRKRPVVIDAFQWNGQPVDNCEIVQYDGSQKLPHPLSSDSILLALKTLEGTMYAEVGDWIITGIHREVYSCKTDIFMKTYELVD